MTQPEFSEAVGVNEQTVRCWEAGEMNPTDHLEAIKQLPRLKARDQGQRRNKPGQSGL